MAFVTRVAGSGSEQRTPWGPIFAPGLTATGGITSTQRQLTTQIIGSAEPTLINDNAAVAASRFISRAEITNPITLDTGSTTAGAFIFIGHMGAKSRNKWVLAIVLASAFTAYDETAQDAAATATFTITIGTSRYTATEGEDGVTFDSDVLTVGGSDYFALIFQDGRGAANVIEDMWDDLIPTS